MLKGFTYSGFAFISENFLEDLTSSFIDALHIIDVVSANVDVDIIANIKRVISIPFENSWK